MNKIKFVILLLVVFMLFSCGFNKIPESWDSYSGRLYLKVFEKSCVLGWKTKSDSSKEEQQLGETVCACIVEQLPLFYPNPVDMPTGTDLNNDPIFMEASKKCVDASMGSDE